MLLSEEIFAPHGDIDQLGLGVNKLMEMGDYFTEAASFPKYLVTHSGAVMQKAYPLVPASVWGEKVTDLTRALQRAHENPAVRRMLVTAHPAEMTAEIDQLLDNAFLDKYDQLLGRVVNDFKDFFPYRVARSNQKLLVFERLDNLRLVEYVLQRL